MDAYILSVLDGLKARYAHEPEFLQAAEEMLPCLASVFEKHPDYKDAALLELAGFDEELAGGVLELAGGVETLCGREDELSSFEHAANSTAAQSAGARSFHTDFFITKHFLSLGNISIFIIRPAATKYFTFRRILHKFHKLRIEKNGEARPPHFMLTPRTAR